MKKLLFAIAKTIVVGPRNIEHKRGGLIRHYIEDAVAEFVDNRILSDAGINLRDRSGNKKSELLHFFIFCRNLKISLYLPLFVVYNTFFAYLKHGGRRTELHHPGGVVLCFFGVITFLKIIALYVFRLIKHAKSRINVSTSTLDCVSTAGAENIAVIYYHGIDLDKRHDLFFLKSVSSEKKYNFFILVNNLSLLSDLKNKLQYASNKTGIEINKNVQLIPLYMPKINLKGLGRSIHSTYKLLKILKMNVKAQPFYLLAGLIFYQRKYLFEKFIIDNDVSTITNTNFDYESSIIAASAFSAGVKSVFKETSVWGDWAPINTNKVICSDWISMTENSMFYARNTHLYVDEFRTIDAFSSIKSKISHHNKNRDSLNILVIGSNSDLKSGFLFPQRIPFECYVRALYSFFAWVEGEPGIRVTYKDKKNNSDFLAKVKNDAKLEEFKFLKSVRFVPNPAGKFLTDYESSNDIFVALGTFYPSSLYELSGLVQKDRLVFWDVTNLTNVYPEILVSKSIRVCKSLSEVKEICLEQENIR